MTTNDPSLPADDPAVAADGLVNAGPIALFPYHHESCGVRTYKAPVAECDCGLLAAIRSTTPPQPDLAAAAQAVVDSAPKGGYINDRTGVSGPALDRLRAALAAAERPVAGGGLDVERLRQALIAEQGPQRVSIARPDPRGVFMDWAERLAAEYAATPPQAPDGGS